jgi:hypothetical protein
MNDVAGRRQEVAKRHVLLNAAVSPTTSMYITRSQDGLAMNRQLSACKAGAARVSQQSALPSMERTVHAILLFVLFAACPNSAAPPEALADCIWRRALTVNMASKLASAGMISLIDGMMGIACLHAQTPPLLPLLYAAPACWRLQNTVPKQQQQQLHAAAAAAAAVSSS